MRSLLFSLILVSCLASHSQPSLTLHFEFNEYALTEPAKAQLDSFLKTEKENLPVMTLYLKGHCDAIGSNSYNDRLSRQRVDAVRDYLVYHGINKTNIAQGKGYGKRKPLNTNNTPDERQLNRRVEISWIYRSAHPGTGEISSLLEVIADSSTIAGSNIVLRNINFYGGQHHFLPGSGEALKELLDVMKKYPALVIRIEGHICCRPDAADGADLETGNNNLSEERAKAVRDYLLLNGIEDKRVSYQGLGHSVPLYPYPEKTELEMEMNRRVEIKIIRK